MASGKFITMDTSQDPVYSRNVVEFVAVANEFCKYAEHASEIKGDEMLRIMQRILPLHVSEGLAFTKT